MREEDIKELIREEVRRVLSEGRGVELMADVKYISDLSKQLDQQFMKFNEGMKKKDAQATFKAAQAVKKIVELMYEATANIPG